MHILNSAHQILIKVHHMNLFLHAPRHTEPPVINFIIDVTILYCSSCSLFLLFITIHVYKNVRHMQLSSCTQARHNFMLWRIKS